MFEKIVNNIVSVSILNDITGEVTSTEAIQRVSEKYYSIKKLNFKGSIMDLFTAQEQICKSSKDISIFKALLYSANPNNVIEVNVSKLSKDNCVSRRNMTAYIKRCKDAGMIRKVDFQAYLINPFMFKSKGSNNSIMEKLQKEWREYELDK